MEKKTEKYETPAIREYFITPMGVVCTSPEFNGGIEKYNESTFDWGD